MKVARNKWKEATAGQEFIRLLHHEEMWNWRLSWTQKTSKEAGVDQFKSEKAIQTNNSNNNNSVLTLKKALIKFFNQIYIEFDRYIQNLLLEALQHRTKVIAFLYQITVSYTQSSSDINTPQQHAQLWRNLLSRLTRSQKIDWQKFLRGQISTEVISYANRKFPKRA